MQTVSAFFPDFIPPQPAHCTFAKKAAGTEAAEVHILAKDYILKEIVKQRIVQANCHGA